MLNKLDNLLAQMTEVNVHLSNLKVKYDKIDKIEQITLAKNDSDVLMKENLNLLTKQSMELKTEVIANNLMIFLALLRCKIVIAKEERTLDADFKVKLERYLIQMKKAKE
ncbi:unnamed protein product, partial [Rotaria magnacalcarata]